jgi:hypothetical protein
MLTTHIFGNAYLKSKLHIGERGEKAKKEKKTLNLIELWSPIERLGSTKLKEKKKGVELAPSWLQNVGAPQRWKKKMSELHIGKKKICQCSIEVREKTIVAIEPSCL